MNSSPGDLQPDVAQLRKKRSERAPSNERFCLSKTGALGFCSLRGPIISTYLTHTHTHTTNTLHKHSTRPRHLRCFAALQFAQSSLKLWANLFCTFGDTPTHTHTHTPLSERRHQVCYPIWQMAPSQTTEKTQSWRFRHGGVDLSPSRLFQVFISIWSAEPEAATCC